MEKQWGRKQRGRGLVKAVKQAAAAHYARGGEEVNASHHGEGDNFIALQIAATP